MSPHDFTFQRHGYRQQVMKTYSVLIRDDVAADEYYKSYCDILEKYATAQGLRGEVGLRGVHFRETLQTDESRFYTGSLLPCNQVGDSMRSRLWIGKSLIFYLLV